MKLRDTYRRFLPAAVLLFVLGATTVSAADSNGLSDVPPGPGLLSEKAISEFKSEIIMDEKSGNKLVISASASSSNPDKALVAKLAKRGKAPIHILCTVNMQKTRGGKVINERQKGSAHFYILGPDGKLLTKKTASLDKMCPS